MAWCISVLLGSSLATAIAEPLLVKLEVRHEVTSRLSNIHISHAEAVTTPLTITYGSCDSRSPEEAHHTVAKVQPTTPDIPSRLVWVLPEDVDHDTKGCLSAWDDAGLLRGRSEPQTLHKRRMRRATSPIPMANASGIDVSGPWFDGVALLKNKQPELIDVKAAKAKSIAIVGAGMSGLMTWLVLSQAGLTNIRIMESKKRLGGRVSTEYLSGGPFDYSYQEMGPMRFPATYTDPVTGTRVNISDHQMVFALAEEMNRLNKRNKKLSVDFIPWIQFNTNGLVYKNGFKLSTGLPPTVAQIAANSSLGPPPLVLDEETQRLQEAVSPYLFNPTFLLEMANNMFRAHKKWLGRSLCRNRVFLFEVASSLMKV